MSATADILCDGPIGPAAPTWEACHAAGMPAAAAAVAMCRTPGAAYRWARSRGVRWPEFRRRYTAAEDAWLRRVWVTDISTAEIARRADRTVGAVLGRGAVLGLADGRVRRQAGKVVVRRKLRQWWGGRAAAVAWCARHGLTGNDTAHLLSMHRSNVRMVVRRDGLTMRSGTKAAKGPLARSRRLAAALRAAMGAGAAMPREAEALLPILLAHDVKIAA